MGEPDLKLDISFSKARGAFPVVAAAFAIVVIIGIVAVMTTDVAERILPMEEQYLYSVVPTMPDGSAPLALKTLANETDNKTFILVQGDVLNRSDQVLKGLLAVIQVNDRFTLPFQTVNVPVEPAELAGNGVGKFRAMVKLGENGLSGYVIQFKLGEDGPFIPHKSDRPIQITK
jgi:hypothetical protein